MKVFVSDLRSFRRPISTLWSKMRELYISIRRKELLKELAVINKSIATKRVELDYQRHLKKCGMNTKKEIIRLFNSIVLLQQDKNRLEGEIRRLG